jgi:hypothetical protein
VDGCGREDTGCEWLDSMIKNLLDARKLRAAHSLKIEFEECDFEMLVQDVVEDLNFAYGEQFVVVGDSDIISIPVAPSVIVDCRRRGRKIEWLSVNYWLDFIIPMQPETISRAIAVEKKYSGWLKI